MNTQVQQVKFKIVLVGDGGVGKTTYIRRIRDGDFEKNYHATLGVNVFNLPFYTNLGEMIIFEVWDTAGQELYSLLSDAYYVGADAAIVMFDVTARSSFKNVGAWLEKIQLSTSVGNQHIPTIVCGNKIDIKERKVSADALRSNLTRRITRYYDISAKCNYNFDKPFLEIARVLSKNPNLIFKPYFQLKPAEIHLDKEDIMKSEQIMKDLEIAKNLKLPDDEF
ncbi:GTP-binding nuclear protein GSP1/Ran [Cucumispora dikerogammari]|nr:GTP-binding nuclear protein GSP1/Ran [Cucumispora dikerogammari]